MATVVHATAIATRQGSMAKVTTTKRCICDETSVMGLSGGPFVPVTDDRHQEWAFRWRAQYQGPPPMSPGDL